MQDVTELPTESGSLRIRDRVKLRRPREILAAAFDEFKQRGYAATRLEDVAKRIGVSKGTIYIYFQNKEELFRAVVKSVVTPTLDRIREVAEGFEGPTEALLQRYLETLYAEVCDNSNSLGLLRLLIAESETFPELTEVYHREVMTRGNSVVADILQRGVDRGEFRADVPVQTPEIVIAPVMMLAMHRMLFGERHPIDVASYMESHIALALAGLRKTLPAQPSLRN